MRLVILSDMAHYHRNGGIVGHGATVREISHLATLFDQVVHVGCLHEGEAPASALPYTAPNVRVRGVPPTGGASFWDKVRILRLYPYYARVMWEELRKADAVHVRCPANVSLLAIVLLALRRHPRKRWIKYAGSWKAYDGEATSYRFQRAWLNRGLARGEVTVNGQWSGQPTHVHTFLNPCLTREELHFGREVAAQKRLDLPVELLFVGHLSEAKGVYQAVDVVRELRAREVPLHLTFVGDGSERERLEHVVQEEELTDAITFAGAIPRTRLEPYLEAAHFMLLPSRAEGWPKVLSEGMAYGAVPVASAVGSIPNVLGEIGLGVVANPEASDVMAEGIMRYVTTPNLWRDESERAVAAAPQFGYSAYQEAVSRLLNLSHERHRIPDAIEIEKTP